MPRGSKPGERRGGRQKGAANKRSREIADKAAAAGITPLEYLLEVMRDPVNETPMRVDAAKAAAPYIHPRLQHVEAKVSGQLQHSFAVPMPAQTTDEWLTTFKPE